MIKVYYVVHFPDGAFGGDERHAFCTMGEAKAYAERYAGDDPYIEKAEVSEDDFGAEDGVIGSEIAWRSHGGPVDEAAHAGEDDPARAAKDADFLVQAYRLYAAIYGYVSDGKFHRIDPALECEDEGELRRNTDYAMRKYRPSGALSVRYRDQSKGLTFGDYRRHLMGEGKEAGYDFGRMLEDLEASDGASDEVRKLVGDVSDGWEIEYDDLGAEVEGDFGGGPIPDGRTGGDGVRYSREYTLSGAIDSYTYETEVGVGDFAGYLGKKPSELTADDVRRVIDDDGNPGPDYDDFVDWLRDDRRDEAQKAAEDDYEAGKIDDDDVRWDDPDDYEPDYEPDYGESLVAEYGGSLNEGPALDRLKGWAANRAARKNDRGIKAQSDRDAKYAAAQKKLADEKAEKDFRQAVRTAVGAVRDARTPEELKAAMDSAAAGDVLVRIALQEPKDEYRKSKGYYYAMIYDGKRLSEKPQPSDHDLRADISDAVAYDIPAGKELRPADWAPRKGMEALLDYVPKASEPKPEAGPEEKAAASAGQEAAGGQAISPEAADRLARALEKGSGWDAGKHADNVKYVSDVANGLSEGFGEAKTAGK